MPMIMAMVGGRRVAHMKIRSWRVILSFSGVHMLPPVMGVFGWASFCRFMLRFFLIVGE